MIKFAPEGYPFIIVSFLSALIFGTAAYSVWKPGLSGSFLYSLMFATGLSVLVTLFMLFFFRDPDRNIPGGEGIYVSPADGKVILIKDVYEKDYLKSATREISIFMSPLDVHVNRAPCDGKVGIVKYSPGKFFAAYKDDASIRNENIVMILEREKGRVLVRQVAGFLARRAVCRAKAGDLLKRGERYGIIKFSSRLDVYLPEDARIMVKIGDKVKAGETVIALQAL
jgi:phosphatidylserine decarboxylase